MSNCPEFGWEYSHGRGQSNNFSQMGMNGSSPGAGRQWLHSNQAYTANTGNTGSMQNSGQNSYGSPSDPFESYNQSMMNQYGKYNPSYGHSLMGPATVNVMMQDSPQGMAMEWVMEWMNLWEWSKAWVISWARAWVRA
ncbi:uncharacterized protein LOC110184016 [Drosophila serrata]|uniref:uncharacterized protein LOC110184016 n=1 Tax=Drosophila serrata TaxID=7274 RepID=UPI000A1CFC7D|nr:uncharacterized protein LOC110184016 [Drosophila serrata]